MPVTVLPDHHIAHFNKIITRLFQIIINHFELRSELVGKINGTRKTKKAENLRALNVSLLVTWLSYSFINWGHCPHDDEQLFVSKFTDVDFATLTKFRVWDIMHYPNKRMTTCTNDSGANNLYGGKPYERKFIRRSSLAAINCTRNIYVILQVGFVLSQEYLEEI